MGNLKNPKVSVKIIEVTDSATKEKILYKAGYRKTAVGHAKASILKELDARFSARILPSSEVADLVNPKYIDITGAEAAAEAPVAVDPQIDLEDAIADAEADAEAGHAESEEQAEAEAEFN